MLAAAAKSPSAGLPPSEMGRGFSLLATAGCVQLCLTNLKCMGCRCSPRHSQLLPAGSSPPSSRAIPANAPGSEPSFAHTNGACRRGQRNAGSEQRANEGARAAHRHGGHGKGQAQRPRSAPRSPRKRRTSQRTPTATEAKEESSMRQNCTRPVDPSRAVSSPASPPLL